MLNLKINRLEELKQKYRENYIDEYYAKKELHEHYKSFWTNSSRWERILSYIFAHKKYINARNVYKNWDSAIEMWNTEYVQKEIVDKSEFFQDILGYQFDTQQQMAVATDNTYNLVLAGAGCGKTLTIAGKVKYLVEEKHLNPKNILLLSFTKKAAEEMTNRICKKMGIEIEATTFHSLGYSILKNVEKKRIDVVNDMPDFINRFFSEEVLKRDNIEREIVEFISLYLQYDDSVDSKTEDRNEENEEYKLYDNFVLKNQYVQLCLNKELKEINEMMSNSKNFEEKEKLKRLAEQKKKAKETLRGEKVKSIQEVIIANFLFLNGVNYEYERPYPHDEKRNDRKNYRPDFYLTDYDIYWEHFGINKEQKAPWLNPVDEQRYLEGIIWKRNIHKKNNTKLIESYSYMFEGDKFEKEFQLILEKNNVKLKKRSNQEIENIYTELFVKNKLLGIENFEKLIFSFINLFKTNMLNEYWFEQIEKYEIITERDKRFLSIARIVYLKYEDYLSEKKYTDFNDMINRAVRYVEDGVWNSGYKYIIVDEYQDISFNRFKLLKSIIKKNQAKLLCVGDDWQSIYRFTGSDMLLFSKFEQFMGKHSTIRIEKTYRNSQELLDIAGDFILKNDAQMQKKLISDKHISHPIECYVYDKSTITEAIYCCLKEISEHSGKGETSVFLLGRNNDDLSLLNIQKNTNGQLSNSKIIFTKSEDGEEIICNSFPNIKIYFLTVHKAKGLEADYSIIINMKNSLDGFPNKITDDKILRLLQHEEEKYQYAEERRLFYVAITRTKNITFLIAPKNQKSMFFEEISKDYEIEEKECNIQDINPKESSERNVILCAMCDGYMIERKGKFGSFLGCSNFPSCTHRISNVTIPTNSIMCPLCGGYMLEKDGPYSKFLYCSNYPKCKYNTSNWIKRSIE